MKAALVALCAWALPSAAGASEVEIVLRPDSAVARPQITLGDVAILRSADFQVLRALVDLPLARISRAGGELLLERSWLRQRIAQAGVRSEAQSWSGPEHIRVTSAVHEVAGEQIAEVASAALRSWLVQRTPGASAQVAQLPAAVQAQGGATKLQARALGHMQPHRRMLVWVDVWAGDQHVRTVAVAFDLDLPDRRSGAFLPDRPLQGQGSAASVAEGASTPQAKTLPAVTRGQWAVLRAEIGQVLSEARVQVLRDGVVGERVPVRPAGASQALLARVIGSGQLEMP